MPPFARIIQIRLGTKGLVDVLDAGRVLIPTLTAHDFRRLLGFTRMELGLAVLPGNPSQLMAAAGPEFG